MNGTIEWLQKDYDKENVSFELRSPARLGYAFKSLNGLAEVAKDTTVTDYNRWALELDQVEGLRHEEQSPYRAMLQAVIYKLDYNAANFKRNLVSYSSIAQNIYDFYHQEQSKKVKSLLSKLIKSNKLEGANTEATLRNIENYIKTNFNTVPLVDPKYGDLAFVLENNVGSEGAIISLYTALMDALAINHELVYTTNRKRIDF